MKIKTTSTELSKIWDELSNVFLEYSKYDAKIEKRLNKLCIETVHNKGNHVKLFFYVKGKKQCIIIATSPSDTYAGRQILRQFRKCYENI